MKQLILSILMLAVGSLHADPILLKAKRYLDVQSGQYIRPANILIEKDTIAAINPSQIPKNVQIIDRPELTLLPGLMDMHVHVHFELPPNYALDYIQTDAAMATLNGVKNAQTLLMAGFTTIRDIGQGYPGNTFVDVALAKASEQGIIAAPHIIPAGHALSITGGHMDPEMVGNYRSAHIPISYKNGVADGVDEVVKAVRYQIKHGAQVIKAGATAGVLSHESSVGAQQYSYEEMKAMVDEATRHGVYVSVHAHGTQGINAAIKAGVRSIEHGSLLDDESIRLMKEKGTYLVPTSYLGYALNYDMLPSDVRQKAEFVIPKARKNLEKAIKANVKIVFGTDTPVFPHGQNAKEFGALVKRGMSPIDAIRTSTINAAEMMNINNKGQIKSGMMADIIGVKGDPVLDVSVLETVSFVMKAGKRYKDN